MGELRPGHADAFRQRAERLRGIALRLTEQASRLPPGGEQSYLLGQAREFDAAATAFDADAAVVDRVAMALRDRSEGRTVFLRQGASESLRLVGFSVEA